MKCNDLMGKTRANGLDSTRIEYKSKKNSHILIPYIVLLFGCIPILQAQTHQEIFNEGTRLLNESRYIEALSVYRQLDDLTMESGALYINMGIAATRIDSLGLAKFYFTKAMQFEEVQLAADEGLEFIEWELGRRGARLPQLAWTRITTTLLFHVNHNQVIVVGILLLNIGVIFIAIHWLRAYKSKTNRYIGISLISTSLLIMMFGIIVQMNAKHYSQAVQISREAQVRLQPNEESEIIQTGYEGFLYIVDERRSINSPEWKYVRMSNGARGWTETNHLKKFK